MNGDELIAEGRRLARPCVNLKDKGGEYAGVWRGSGPFEPPEGKLQHWISVDCRYMPGKGQIRACLSVYLGHQSNQPGIVVVRSETDLPRTSDGTRLYAAPSTSLPPLESVFKFGSSRLRAWLAENGWSPEWGYNGNFKDRDPVRAYEEAFQKESPLYTSKAYAVLGGWHVPWPDEDWDGLANTELILWTIAESEPWVEVWQDGSTYRVIRRIT